MVKNNQFVRSERYDKDGDYVEVYLSDKRCYSKQIDKYLTIHYNDTDYENGLIVGYTIHNIGQIAHERDLEREDSER